MQSLGRSLQKRLRRGTKTTVKKRRNPNQFTTDEVRTATLIETEGSSSCQRVKGRPRIYPFIEVRMCNRDALKPVASTFGTTISHSRSANIQCPPELFPPDGRGIWEVRTLGERAESVMARLDPMLTPLTRKKWQKTKRRCQYLTRKQQLAEEITRLRRL